MKGKHKCGYCELQKIPPGEQPKIKCNVPICDDCWEDWNRCFPPTLTTVNNLSIVIPVSNNHLER
jgi:hypothetical protein